MQPFRRILPFVLALCGLVGTASASATAAEDAQAKSPALSVAQIESPIGRLEGPAQRHELVTTLRMLAQAGEQSDSETQGAHLKTAAAEMVDLLADRVSDLAVVANTLLPNCRVCRICSHAGSTICALRRTVATGCR